MQSHVFHPTTLREYDIRGIIGETLGELDAEAIGRGFGTEVRRAGGSIEINDNVPQGTVFSVFIPFQTTLTAGPSHD